MDVKIRTGREISEDFEELPIRNRTGIQQGNAAE